MGLNMVASSESPELATGNKDKKYVYVHIYSGLTKRDHGQHIYNIYKFHRALIAKTKSKRFLEMETKDLKTQRNRKMDVGTKM